MQVLVSIADCNSNFLVFPKYLKLKKVLKDAIAGLKTPAGAFCHSKGTLGMFPPLILFQVSCFAKGVLVCQFRSRQRYTVWW